MESENEFVYGPLASRRLGQSLGVNLAPAGRKACNFVCAYCRSGWTEPPSRRDWPRPSQIVEAVDRALRTCGPIDAIDVAGNGEPTLHPGFAMIADALFRVRALRAPHAKLSVLTNGSTLSRPEILGSFSRFDTRSVKFDAGDATTFRLVNGSSVALGRLIADLRFLRDVTLHATFVRDAAGAVDNTTPRALDAWIGAVQRIRPVGVDICTPRRKTSSESVVPVPADVLEGIAARVRSTGIPVRVLA